MDSIPGFYPANEGSIPSGPTNLFTYPEQWKLFGVISRTPLPEVMYLEGEEAWIQWDLAVKLQDKRNGL